MQASTLVFGVDVAKAELVVATCSASPSRQTLPNQAGAIHSWLRSMPSGSVVAMESTGRYHVLLAQLAHASGMRVFVLNARDVYFYAKALSARGKTDRLDAGVIARYVAEHHDRLRPWQPAGATEQALQALLGRRWLVTTQRVNLRQSFRDVPSLDASLERVLHELAHLLEDIDREMERLVAADETLANGVRRLRTITGFGLQTSVALAALLRRFEFENLDALVAYTGLDPRPCDSGTKRGTRRLSKRGPAYLRRLLYLAGFAASHSKVLGPLYQKLRQQGFATTQAIVILARKLLRIAWGVWKSGQEFNPELIGDQGACTKA